ncbi:glycosyltransferase family 39 protein [Micromonospora sp. ATA32]|nr:glycosyltransferase family 39 protein [Micromonospora sp. ATA32]
MRACPIPHHGPPVDLRGRCPDPPPRPGAAPPAAIERSARGTPSCATLRNVAASSGSRSTGDAGPAAGGGPVGSTRWTGPVWLSPTLATLVIALVGIGRAQPWRDELATWSAATRPLGDLVRLAGTIDAATGPYYLFMHAWVAVFGDSVTALRLPAALAMSGAAGLTAVLGERLLGARAGLLAGLLFAALPGTCRYGQEARPYALATLLAVLATLLLVGALRRPGWGRWAGYAVAVTALGLAHLIALALLAGHAMAVLTAWRSRRADADGPSLRDDGTDDGRPTLRDDRTDDADHPPSRRGRRLPLSWLLALLPAALVLAPAGGGGPGAAVPTARLGRPGPADRPGGVAGAGWPRAVRWVVCCWGSPPWARPGSAGAPCCPAACVLLPRGAGLRRRSGRPPLGAALSGLHGALRLPAGGRGAGQRAAAPPHWPWWC